MNLDRGTLARLDRKLLAGLGQDEAYRTVRVRCPRQSGPRGVAATSLLASPWGVPWGCSAPSMSRSVRARRQQSFLGIDGGSEEERLAQRPTLSVYDARWLRIILTFS